MIAQPRITLTIDIFERRGQQAQVWSNLKPAELIAAALAEFGGEQPYLGNDPQRYRLVRVGGAPLRDDEALREGDRLRLEECDLPSPPPGAQPPPQALYLRDQERGAVYPLPWLPAIIGRTDHQHPEPLLAVNLGGLPTGPRVSRRHARIVARGDTFFVERLADNPTIVRNAQGSVPLVQGTPIAIGHGDVIVLAQSQIELMFIIRQRSERSGP